MSLFHFPRTWFAASFHACTMLVLFSQSACRVDAALVSYTLESTFNTATAGRRGTPQTFEGIAVGTALSNVVRDGIRYDTNNQVGGGGLIVTNGNAAVTPGENTLRTVSPVNFLGAAAPGNFDTITNTFVFDFLTPVSGVGLYIISNGFFSSGEISLTFGGQIASLNPANEIQFAGSGSTTSSFAYFLGVAEDTNPANVFTRVTITGSAAGAGFGIDNITSVSAVPEPSSLVLLASVSIAGWYYRVLRRKKVVFALGS